MPKTLTKSQFQSLRPKGRKKWNYQNYLAYIAKRRGPVDPIMEQATQMVAQQLNPIKAEYEWAAKERMEDAMAASRAGAGFTAALGRSIGSIPEISGGAYQAAAAALMGASGGLQARGADVVNTAGSAALADVARLSGMDISGRLPEGGAAMAGLGDYAEVDAAMNIGKAPFVTATMEALDAAGRFNIANWADLERRKGVDEAGDIREKFLIEAKKRPGLIQQAYLSLKKDAREARAMDITAAKMRLDQARLALDRADSLAERKAANRELILASRELNAKIQGKGYYEKFPPGSGGKTPKEKNAALAQKRDAELANITGEDGLSFARKLISDKAGNWTFGTKNLPRQRLIRLLAAHYWPLLKNYAGPKSQKRLNDNMMARIIKLVNVLAQDPRYPWLQKNYKPTKPTTPKEEEDSGSSGGSGYEPP